MCSHRVILVNHISKFDKMHMVAEAGEDGYVSEKQRPEEFHVFSDPHP